MRRPMDATAQELVARLRRDPDDADAFASLRAHYHQVGDYASLANLLEGWAQRAPDVAAGAHALYEAGELVLGALSDRERAIQLYERALAADPRHQDAFLRTRGLFHDAGEMRRLAELLERHAGALEAAGGDPQEIALLCHQLGELWEHRFTRVDKAVHHYRRAFELDPGLVPAIYAAREIYRQAGNTKAAASLLEKEAKAELDPARRAALWRELAHIRVEQLGDHEGAARALKRALGDAPGDLEITRELAGVYLARAEQVQDPHVAESDRHRAADLFYQLAQKVPAEHALAYLEGALDGRPDHDGALALYERFADELGESERLPARWVAYLAHASDRPEAAHRRMRLADAYLEAGQVDYAITTLEWLLDEGEPHAASRLVDLYRAEGRDDDAVRALGVAAMGLAPSERVPRLRELLSTLQARGDLEAAVRWAHEILSLDPSDPEALTLIEDGCRQSGDYTAFRDALLAASRVNGLSVDARKQRLKDVASISELRLEDLDGAINAWRGVAALDPADREARGALKRLLTARERWDDLVDVLEREALTLSDPAPKTEIYRQLAEIHRGRRGDLEGAVRALRHLRDIAPEDIAGRDALADALLEAGATLEAVPLLRQRIDESRGDARVELLRRLANVLEQDVGDQEGAFEAWARLLDEQPTDLEALSHMEAIDEAAGRHERLVSTLSYRVEVIEPAERPAVLVRMGQIAERSLGDLDRAAELYRRALELLPGDASTLDALCAVYDRAERYRDLVILLRETANAETDVTRRAELYRRIARTLADRVGNDDGAAEAWRAVLMAGEDEEALRFLRRHATRTDDPASLDDTLRRLAELLEGSSEVRDLMLERAELLAERLERPQDAIAVLRRVVDELAPEHVVALGRLAALCEQTGDVGGLTETLWRQLRLLEDPGLRLPVARRLSDLHESEAPDPALAIEALSIWASADPEDGDPLERLAPRLEDAGRFEELTRVLDRLASLAAPSEGAALWRRSADVAYRQLGDVDGAWARLEHLVRSGDAEAEAALRELARGAQKGERLAELYVALAQSGEAEPQQRWLDAARVYETYLNDAPRALEAVLRAFALDLTDRACLDDADRLSERAGAWPRLSQVYETLLKHEEHPEEKVALLLRHAALLDERARDASAALDQTLRACALAPHDDAILALAEDRAGRAGRADELLITYDKRKQRAEDDAGRVEALLRALRLSELTLRDRPRATQYLAQAIALAIRSPELDESVVAAARELDAQPGAPGGLVRAIVDIEAALADDMEDEPLLGGSLLLRAAQLLADVLRTDDEAFAMFERAATMAPSEAHVLDALEAFARRAGRLPDVDRRLAALVEEALDNRTASELLRRRAVLLEELGRFDDVVEVWRRLTTVASGDLEARAGLRAALRRSGKHQELLVALQRDVRRADAANERLTLMKEIALVWEREIQNRFEALDAWRKVAKEAPDDPDANEALARLEAHKPKSLDSDLLTSFDAPGSFADRTEPGEVGAPDSSETVLEPDLRAALQDAERARDRETVQRSEPLPPLREVPTRKLDPNELVSDMPALGALAAPGANDEPAADLSMLAPARPEDFDDDYTSLAEQEDLFQQLRELQSKTEASDELLEELGTGEVELLDDAAMDQFVEDEIAEDEIVDDEIAEDEIVDDEIVDDEIVDDEIVEEELSGDAISEVVEDLGDSDLQSLDELELREVPEEEELEDLDGLEEIAPPTPSIPPPPPRR